MALILVLLFPNTNFIKLSKLPNKLHDPLFNSGVLYSSGHSKGEILTEFLQKLSWKPKKVIFVDDEIVYVQSVIACLDKEGISCLGIHYTAANDVSYDLNLEQARFQINYFIEHDIWLGDEECKYLYSNHF